MPRLSVQKKVIVIVLLCMSFIILAVSFFIQTQRSAFAFEARVKISQQENALIDLAQLMGADKADSVVSSIIKDCNQENRKRFDLLLGSLAQLNTQDLSEIQQLFNACGDFYAQQKAVMVTRFEREYNAYKDFIDVLSAVDPQANGITYNIEDWKKLVDLEKQRSQLSTRLVDIQGEIITSLRSNISITSDEMQLLLVEGQQTRDTLVGLSAQIDSQRQTVLAL